MSWVLKFNLLGERILTPILTFIGHSSLGCNKYKNYLLNS